MNPRNELLVSIRPHEGGPVLVFESGDQRYGLPADNVLQIVQMMAIAHLPATPAVVVGIIDFHGKVIPIVDMRRRPDRPEGPYSLSTPIVVSRLDGRTVGWVVDGISEVVDLQAEGMEPPDQIFTKVMTPRVQHLAGVARLADRLAFLLDPADLLSREEEKALGKAVARQRRRSRKAAST
jgi:purine-binding chemotaxis protein CheW